MPTVIKTGYWRKSANTLKSELNLEGLIEDYLVANPVAPGATPTLQQVAAAGSDSTISLTVTGSSKSISTNNPNGNLATISSNGYLSVKSGSYVLSVRGTTSALEYNYNLFTTSLRSIAHTASRTQSLIDATGSVMLSGTIPASATATGVVGQTAVDSTYFYVCIAPNAWRRIAHATW